MAPHSSDVGEYLPSEEVMLHTSATGGLVLEKYTLEDVSHHSSPTDCWLVIWGKVYDVTRWYRPKP